MVLHSPITRSHMHMRPAITPRMATINRITMVIIGPMDTGIPTDTGITGPIDIGDIVDGDYPCHVRPQVMSPAGITKALTPAVSYENGQMISLNITKPFKQTFQGIYITSKVASDLCES
jgi:hypothetical protein